MVDSGPRAQQILETCLYVDDLPAAVGFYRRVLGLELFSEVAGRHAFFRCGGGVFLLFDAGVTSRPGGLVPAHGAYGVGHVAFAMEQGEIAAWRERLQRQGVAVEAEVEWPGGGYSLYLRDPSGNSLELATPATWGV